MTQPSVSQFERQSDMKLSTLGRVVAAFGGELVVTAPLPQDAERQAG